MAHSAKGPWGAGDALYCRVYVPGVSALCPSSLSAVTAGSRNKLTWSRPPLYSCLWHVLYWLLRRREALLGWKLTATMAFYKAPNNFLKNIHMVPALLSRPSP